MSQVVELQKHGKGENSFYIPTEDTNINEIIQIIHDNTNENNAFIQYLCDILDEKYKYHIFNTYLYLDSHSDR